MRARRYRISLRLFLILFTASCVLIGWFATRLQIAQSIAALESMGISVQGDEFEPDSVQRKFKRLFGLAPVVKVLGANSDQAMEHLGRLRNLRMLSVRGDVSDDGLKHLQKLNKIETLIVNSPSIDDVGLRYLAEQHQLRELNLELTNVTSDGLTHLAGLTQLKRLDVDNGRISYGAVAHLFVDLQHRTVLDALYAVRQLRDPPDGELKQLTLHGPQIGDDLLPYIASLETLERLA